MSEPLFRSLTEKECFERYKFSKEDMEDLFNNGKPLDYDFISHSKNNKKKLMRKTKKELVNLIIFKEEFKDKKIRIMAGNEVLLSYPINEEWRAFTISCYIKDKEIEEIAIWKRHMIDVWKNKSNNIFRKIIWWIKK